MFNLMLTFQYIEFTLPSDLWSSDFDSEKNEQTDSHLEDDWKCVNFPGV